MRRGAGRAQPERSFVTAPSGLPARGAAVRALGLVLPPDRLPLRLGGRPLKRWRYVGVFTPEVMLCVAEARIGPLPLRWWAVALPDEALRGRSTSGRGGVRLDGARVHVEADGVRIDLDLDENEGVETISPAGEGYAWTRKQAGVGVRGSVGLGGRRLDLSGARSVVDDSAGYHLRHTAWRWSAGVGTAADGRRVGWNLVAGIHDAPGASERTVWIDGEPREVGPVAFAPDLSAVAGLRFSEWSAREDHANLMLLRSHYRQPFGTFTGELPGGIGLAEGFGVMESHDVRW